MDIHRCRFVPYPASPINTLAFSHVSSASHRAPRTLRLAIGRANGDIEIWNPRAGIWVQEKILRGSLDRSIEGLAWTQDPVQEGADGEKIGGKLRLFSIGYSAVVTEWDLAAGKPTRHSTGNYGEIWCLEPQPRSNAPRGGDGTLDDEENSHQKLAVGCADGAVVLHSTAGDDLRYLRTLPRPSNKKARVLSLSWQNADKIVAGCSDNAIRVFDIRGKGRILQTISLGSGPRRGPQETLVWTIKCLPDGSIVTGDSSGEIKIWDSATFSLTQRLKSHNADVLSLSLSLDGKTMVSGGIDRRTVVYRRVDVGPTQSRWTEINHRRLHTSDVKTMAAFESKNFNVTVSGGLDATAIVLPRGGLGQENHRRLAVLPNYPPLLGATSERLVVSYWGTEVRLWRLGQYSSDPINDDNLGSNSLSHKLVAKLSIQGIESIASAALARDGSMLAVSTLSTTKLFRLHSTSASALSIRKVKAPNAISQHGASLLEFSPDTKWLLQVRSDSGLMLFRICWNEATEDYMVEPRSVKLERKDRAAPHLKASEGTHGNYIQSVQRIAWSTNSRLLVACDMRGAFDSWALEGQEDLTQGDDNLKTNGTHRPSTAGSDDSSDEDEPIVVFGQRWTRLPQDLPKLGCAPLVLAFRPEARSSAEAEEQLIAPHPTRHNPHPHSREVVAGEDRLVVVSSKHQLFEYHVMTGSLTDWSRRNPPDTLPLEFQNIRERAMGAIWDLSARSERFWLYGSSWLWMFNLGLDMPSHDDAADTAAGDSVKQIGKRKRERDAKEDHLLMQDTSGAGSRILATDYDLGMRPALLETNGSDMDWISLETNGGAHAEGNQSAPTTTKSLVKLRRGDSNTSSQRQLNGNSASDVSMLDAERHSEQQVHSWGTFKYRPILGIVPIESHGHPSLERQRAEEGTEWKNIEVALVERPLWDIELPNRWEGDQEWNR